MIEQIFAMALLSLNPGEVPSRISTGPYTSYAECISKLPALVKGKVLTNVQALGCVRMDAIPK